MQDFKIAITFIILYISTMFIVVSCKEKDHKRYHTYIVETVVDDNVVRVYDPEEKFFTRLNSQWHNDRCFAGVVEGDVIKVQIWDSEMWRSQLPVLRCRILTKTEQQIQENVAKTNQLIEDAEEKVKEAKEVIQETYQ
jgi:hypothetical protein